MQKNKIQVSIIIVHYKVKKELFDCISSVYKSKPKSKFEIIVVDNDEIKTIKQELQYKFPKVKYLENVNNGWGGGINKGLEYSEGEYIYLLNPDTLLINNAIDRLIEFFKSKDKVGVASSILYDKNKKIYPLQGTKILTPLRAIFSLSLINKYFPNNRISRDFWMRGWNKSRVKEVESATLSAALIKKDLLVKVGGFDEKYFLYYEEYDLAKRLKSLGYRNYIIPSSKVVHLWEVSTTAAGNTNKFMEESRAHYFYKYYGVFTKSFVEFFLSLNKEKLVIYILLTLILVLAIFLRFFNLEDFSLFIGDQAWFFIFAREMVATGRVPLLGITSSHTWISQGPLWTYMLAPVLLVSNFNPISGFYLSSVIGVIAVFISYILGKETVSPKFGLIYAFLFTISPLTVFHSRFSYHTTPIPLLVLLFSLFLFKWINGNKYYFTLVLLVISLLYNFELATVFLIPIVMSYLLFGFLKKKDYAKKILNKRIIILSVGALALPMVPVLIHDVKNGFSQTIVFAGWFIYKACQFLGLFPKSPLDESSTETAFNFFAFKYTQLSVPDANVGLAIFLASLAAGILFLSRSLRLGSVILPVLAGLAIYFAAGVPSEAYLVILLPGLLYLLSLLVIALKKNVIILIVLILVSVINLSHLFREEFLTKDSVTLKDKIESSQRIVRLAGEDNYHLLYTGPGQQFESSVMPYEYLVWWISGKKPYEKKPSKTIIIEEFDSKINIKPAN